MRKRVLSLLLTVLLALTVMAPLAGVANAANSPSLRLLYLTDDGVNNYLEYMDLSNLGNGDKLKASVDANQKTVILTMNQYQTDRFAIYVNMPSSSWDLMVHVMGKNDLMVRYNELTKSYMALGTNGSMTVYTLENGSSLNVTGDFGKTGAAALTYDYYGLYAGDGIYAGSLGSGGVTMGLNLNFNLKLTSYCTKAVYPFGVSGSGKNTTLNNVSYAYNFNSNYSAARPENMPIILDGTTYFYTNYATTGLSGMTAHAYHSIKYADTFRGLVHIETTNGYYYGGPYSQEANTAVLAQRHLAVFDNRQEYHAVAKNCGLTLTRIEPATLKSVFNFPIAYGYVLPATAGGTGFEAKIKWTVGDDTTDVTGQKVEYGKSYKATITVVPWGFHYFPSNDDMWNAAASHSLIPQKAASFGFTKNEPYADSFFFRYNPVYRPNTQITKQPVDFNGIDTSTRATFSVDTNDTAATYQWQIADSASGPWTDVKDYTNMSATPVTGAKTKNLNYDFGYYNSSAGVDFRANLKYLRCKITGTVDGASGVLYSNVVKYEYTQTNIKKIVITGLDEPVGGAALDTYASSSTTGITVNKVYYTENSSAVTSVEEGDIVYVTVDFTVDGKYAVNPKTTVAEWNGQTCRKAYSGDTQYLLQIGANAYRCEFRFVVPRIIREITIKNVRQPYQYMGFITELPNVAPLETSHCYTGFRNGWYDEIRGSTGKAPVTGETFYLYLQLGADEGYRFNGDLDDITVDLLGLAGEDLYPEIVYLEELRSRDWKNDTLCMWIGFECTEMHIRKGNSIRDMDVPKAGKPLDTDISFTSGNLKLEFVKYAVNGKMVEDYTKELPKAGDQIDIYVGVSKYFDEMIYDSNIFCYWYQDDDNMNAVRTERDWSLPYGEDICVFRYKYTIPETNVVTLLAFTRVTQPSKAQKTTSSALAYNFDQIKLLDNNGEWYLYDPSAATITEQGSSNTFQPGSDYMLRFHVALRDGFTASKDKPEFALYDIYGGKVDFYDAKVRVLDDRTLYVDFYMHALDKHPLLPVTLVDQITLLNVAAPVAGEKITTDATALAEPVKIAFTTVSPTWKHRVNGEWVDVADGDTFKAGDEYALIFAYDANPINDLYRMKENKDLHRILLMSPDGKELKPDSLEIRHYTVGHIGYAATCTFTASDEAQTVMLGDVDNDTKITSSDARLALRRAVNLETYAPGSREYVACDVDRDGKVTSSDARSILRAAVNLEDPAAW